MSNLCHSFITNKQYLNINKSCEYKLVRHSLELAFIQEYLGFILAINDAIKSKMVQSISDIPVSNSVENIIFLLEKLDTIIDETPPIQQPQRFGNKAFRTWHQTFKEVKTNRVMGLH